MNPAGTERLIYQDPIEATISDKSIVVFLEEPSNVTLLAIEKLKHLSSNKTTKYDKNGTSNHNTSSTRYDDKRVSNVETNPGIPIVLHIFVTNKLNYQDPIEATRFDKKDVLNHQSFLELPSRVLLLGIEKFKHLFFIDLEFLKILK